MGGLFGVYRRVLAGLVQGEKSMSKGHLEIVIKSEMELGKAVDALLHFAEGSKKIALMGNLGAGKTAFVKAFCRRLNVEDNVSSPTFALVNEYVFLDENAEEQPIHHLDLYRLKSMDEALDIGIEEYLDDAHYCLIEWPEIIAELLPEDMISIKIETLPDESRQFLFSK